jgi:hypothetical protein
MTRRRRVLGTAAVWLVGFGVLRVSLLAPETCPSVSQADVRATATAAAGWLAAGQQPNGRYLYEHDRATGRALPGYNLVRHAGVTMSLYQLAAVGGDGGDRALSAADAGLEYMLRRLERAGDGVALVDRDAPTARAGASALMVAALLDRRLATSDRRYDDQLRALGRFLSGLVGRDGHVAAELDVTTDEPIDVVSRYVTGEVGWALARLHTTFPSEGWDANARTILDHLATERDQTEQLLPAPWPDQWAAYLLAELAPTGLSSEHVLYARTLAERFGTIVRVESQKDGWPPIPFVDVRARGAGLGVWVEGLGSLARVAEVDPRLADIHGVLDERVACGAGLLVARQVVDGGPQEVGAWFRGDLTRMDDQQHALSALLGAVGLLTRSR